MRADRLLAVLLLLQARGRVTAAEVADELEVSERTARRDLEALAISGVPVYSRQGRGGGWELIGGARTDLTGLTAAETRALFLVLGPTSPATPQAKAAVRKLLGALPEPLRLQAEATAANVLVDRVGWWGRGGGAGAPGAPGDEPPAPPLLDAVQHAVVAAEQLRLHYTARDGQDSERTIHPLGLAAKGRHWYVLADTEAGLRTFRVDRIRQIEPTGAAVVRPEGFDLHRAWQELLAAMDERWMTVVAHGWLLPESVGMVRGFFGRRLRLGPPGPDGRLEVEVAGPHPRPLAGELSGWVAHLEVTGPAEVTVELAQIGAALVARHGPRSPDGGAAVTTP
ncbi:MAG: WYL domain-containing protein [Acidimicrobiales bacterium]